MVMDGNVSKPRGRQAAVAALAPVAHRMLRARASPVVLVMVSLSVVELYVQV